MSPAAVRASRAIPCEPPIAANPVTSSTAESMPQASAVTRQPTIPRANPPASTGIRPTRSMRPTGRHRAEGAGQQEDRRAEAEDPLDPRHQHERRGCDGDAELEHSGETGQRPRQQDRVAHDRVVVHASDLRRPSRNACAPPWDGWRTPGAPSARSATRPTGITGGFGRARPGTTSDSSISARVGRPVRVRLRRAGAGASGRRSSRASRSSSPSSASVRRTIVAVASGGPAAGELALRGERDPGDAGAAVAGRLADEQQRRVFASLEVGKQPVAPRVGAVAVTIEVERRADRGAAQPLDELLHHHPHSDGRRPAAGGDRARGGGVPLGREAFARPGPVRLPSRRGDGRGRRRRARGGAGARRGGADPLQRRPREPDPGAAAAGAGRAADRVARRARPRRWPASPT